MSSVHTSSESATGSPPVKAGEVRLEVVVVPVSDVDRAKAFYKRLVKKKLKPVAKTATARKLLVKLTIMLRDNITAQEFDLRGRTVGNARGGIQA